MNKLLTLFLIFTLAFIIMGNVAATDTFTITVTDKHILGNSGGGTYGGPLFILEDNHQNNGMGDCLIYYKDYYKVHLGDTVTLKAPDEYGYCEIIKINNQEINTDGWC